MLIGVPKEIKEGELRVGMTPSGAERLVAKGHTVFIEQRAGLAVGFSDQEYQRCGAQIVDQRQLWELSELIVKVKELQPSEYSFMRKGQTLFAYLHLAPDPQQTEALVKSGMTAIAYETITDRLGGLPLLAPMSEIAGRLAIQIGAYHLLGHQGGKAKLLGGLPGVAPGHVVILGGGNVGREAARVALGLGAKTTLLDKEIERLRYLSNLFGPALTTLCVSQEAICQLLPSTDLLVGAALIPAEKAPRLITRSMLSLMEPGSVFVDVSIDQGGISETSLKTSHEQPTYVEEGVIHYCVPNMPGAAARSATEALTNATSAYLLELCSKGVLNALQTNPYLCQGLNIFDGKVTNQPVAEALGYTYHSPKELLSCYHAIS